ncbi:MAG TPA: transglycosylase domain-containing protein [Acidobacteriaceae bacterium]|nr:transglycosylase domain-containing protein [Acidobacteriaceae bacterium]
MAGNEKTPRTPSRSSVRTRDGRGGGTGTGTINRPRNRTGRGGKLSQTWRSSWKMKLLLGVAAFVLLVCAISGIVFAYYYHAYEHVVEQRLRQPLFASTAKIYAAPREVRPNQKYAIQKIADDLLRAGYSRVGLSHPSQIGTFSATDSSIHIQPGPQSYHAPDGATVYTSKGVVTKIQADDGQELTAYELEPELITGLSDKNRGKRRLVTYNELPKYLVPAVTSIEDRRFFERGAVDYVRVFGAFFADLRSRRYSEGSSTLTMQLARLFFLSPEKRFKRKIIQTAIAFQLEHRYTKPEIFTMYANEIPLGQRGSFAINGFGEAAQAYFGKNIRDLNLQECALLAGIIQGPSRLSPYKHPQRALARRNLVLDAMVETHDITREQADQAKAVPLHLAPFSVDEREAPYFVDLVREKLTERYGDRDINGEGLHIYTSLDPDLQTVATVAVENGMEKVDEIIRKRYERRARHDGAATPSHIVYPQVALIAMNPHTGQVLALVGGRNYGASQLNHAVSQRPTGSIFKPFVYATGFNSSLTGVALPGQQGVFTAVTMLNDADTTFNFDNGNVQYAPHNYKNEQMGMITARQALMHSQNVATVALAQMVGLDNVVALAHQAGITSAQATPSIALGAYDASPLEMAGAYTIFANNGMKIDPNMIASVRTADGDVVDDFAPISKPVLDPRVAYLTLSLMRDVINHGTAAGVRGLGFSAPAAGKTGTSHDAWFAGFTSNLLCVIWVGNDDYSDIKLEGAQAAAPMWADFMKNAIKLPQYSDTQYFDPPAGITEVSLDKATNLIADASCPEDYTAAFLDGTQPTGTCDHPNGDQRNIFQKMFGLGGNKAAPPTIAPPPANVVQPQPPGGQNPSRGNNPEQNPNEAAPKKKKKGFFGKVFGVFKGDDNNQSQPDNTQPPQNQ